VTIVRLAFPRLSALLAAMLLPLAALAQQLVVIESTAAELPAGHVIEAGKAIKLPTGASVTLVADNGQVTTIAGPFSGVPKAAGGKGDAGLVAALSQIVAPKSASSLGVTRSSGSKAAARNTASDIDVRRPGPYCVLSGHSPTLWRSDPSKGGRVTVQQLPGNEKAVVEWPADAERVAWPPAIPIKDDSQYLVGPSWRTSQTKIAVFLVPDGLPSDPHRAVWMNNQGCVQQARALLANLR
jgi:hypothetical protein